MRAHTALPARRAWASPLRLAFLGPQAMRCPAPTDAGRGGEPLGPKDGDQDQPWRHTTSRLYARLSRGEKQAGRTPARRIGQARGRVGPPVQTEERRGCRAATRSSAGRPAGGRVRADGRAGQRWQGRGGSPTRAPLSATQGEISDPRSRETRTARPGPGICQDWDFKITFSLQCK